MISADLRNSAVISTASGLGIAALWYAASASLLSGTASETVPMFGAIALAAVVPPIVLNKKVRRKFHGSNLSMSQRLEALNKHALINIVNEKDELTEVNDKLLELTGYRRDELIGQPVRILYDAGVQEIAFEIRSHLRRGENWEGETPLRRKDGSTLFTQSTIMPLFDADGHWAGSVSARTDVTRTRALIAERQTAQTLYELRDDIWIIDSETEKFCYMNRAAKGRLNMGWEEIRNTQLEEFSRFHNIDEVLYACRDLRRTGEMTAQFEARFMNVPADISIKFLPNAQGAGRYLVLLNDISDRIEQEKRKSAFISTVSHELRSPLTSIKGAMGLLLSQSAGELPEKAMDLLEIAHRNSDRLVLIINDILDLDKISNGQMEFEVVDVDLAELIGETDQANAMLQQRFGVQVNVTGTEKAIPFRTDPNRFIQVLTNLLTNAYKFSKPNGRILIDVQDEANHIRISVQDEGLGIPLSEQHKVFDRFADMSNSDRASKGGTGLGLNICKAIVENMGGSIGFETEEGRGTTFNFRLPKTLPDCVTAESTRSKRSA